MDTDERDLIARSQKGDHKAFEELVKRYQRKVFGIAYGIVRNAEDAMDVSQEVFLRSYRNLKGFKGQSRFYTWIYRIAVNLSIDVVNKRKKTPLLLQDEARSVDDASRTWEGLLPNCGNPARELDTRELGEQVVLGLDQLSEKHRAVLILREVEGLSYQEISLAMDCSRGTVMSRLFHARANMKKVLRAYLNGEEGVDD